MKLAGFANLLEPTYTDRLDIYRYTEVLNDDGTKGLSLSQTPLYSDVKARISFETRDNPETSLEDTNPKYLQTKIFCRPEVDIKKGDKLVVRRINDDGSIMATYQGTANLPFTYTTHKEIEFIEVGDA